MHLTLDGSLLPTLFVLAFVIWASGPYLTAPVKGSRWILAVPSALALGITVFLLLKALLGF